MFQRTQQDFKVGNSIQRQHYVPKEFWAFAFTESSKSMKAPGPNGGPTIPDIYYALALEGLKIANKNRVAKPVFIEYGRPEGNRSAIIKFPIDVNDKLIDLKARVDSGEFAIEGAKEISLLSLVVNLIRLAVEKRQQEVSQ